MNTVNANTLHAMLIAGAQVYGRDDALRDLLAEAHAFAVRTGNNAEASLLLAMLDIEVMRCEARDCGDSIRVSEDS